MRPEPSSLLSTLHSGAPCCFVPTPKGRRAAACTLDEERQKKRPLPKACCAWPPVGSWPDSGLSLPHSCRLASNPVLFLAGTQGPGSRAFICPSTSLALSLTNYVYSLFTGQEEGDHCLKLGFRVVWICFSRPVPTVH